MGLVFWKDTWSVQKLIGIAIIIASVVLLALSPNTKFDIGTPTNIGWFLMVLASWGSASCFYMPAALIPNIVFAILYMNLGYGSLTYLVVAIFYRTGISYDGSRDEIVSFFAGFTIILGTNLYIVIIRTYREASTIAPLGSLYIIITVILGISVLGESVTVYKIVGGIMACVAILLLTTKDVRTLIWACFPKRTAKVSPAR